MTALGATSSSGHWAARAVAGVAWAACLAWPSAARAQLPETPTLADLGLEYISASGFFQLSLSGQLDLEAMHLDDAWVGLATREAGESLVPILSDSGNDRPSPRVIAWPKAVRDGDWKLVMENRVKPELYNIRQDRNEKRNLAEEFPARVQRLQRIHAQIHAGR